MVDRQLAFSILQLVALSLPAFAILLQMMIESGFPYTKEAVPITTASFALLILTGLIVLGNLLTTTSSLTAQLAIGTLALGLLGMLIGAGLIGLQTRRAQQRLDETDD